MVVREGANVPQFLDILILTFRSGNFVLAICVELPGWRNTYYLVFIQNKAFKWIFCAEFCKLVHL